MAEGAGRQASGNSALYSAFGVVTTTVAGRAAPNTHLAAPAGGRVEMLDDLDQRRGIDACQRSSR